MLNVGHKTYKVISVQHKGESKHMSSKIYKKQKMHLTFTSADFIKQKSNNSEKPEQQEKEEATKTTKKKKMKLNPRIRITNTSMPLNPVQNRIHVEMHDF